jgi:sugar-specific transcriptional regulator TrmB
MNPIATASRSPARARQPLASTLRELGFSDYEAKSYVALATHQPATAYEIAKVTGLPRANVYGALRNLEAKGAIQPVTERPLRYVPVDPEQFFQRLQRNTAGLCDDAVLAVKRDAKDEESAYVWLYRGAHEVHDKVIELIASAREQVWIKASAARIEPYCDALGEAARRGVKIRLVAFGKDLALLRGHPDIQVFPHEGDGKSHGVVPDALLTATFDNEGMMIVSHTGKVVGSYARDPSIIYVIQTLLLHEIYFAEIYAALGPQLEARFGKRLEKLRRKYRPTGRERPVMDAD